MGDRGESAWPKWKNTTLPHHTTPAHPPHHTTPHHTSTPHAIMKAEHEGSRQSLSWVMIHNNIMYSTTLYCNSMWQVLYTRPNYTIQHHITSHHTMLHYITLHHITLHYITSHYVTLHYITSHHIALHYITLCCIALHYITCITLHYITSHSTIPHHTTLHQTIWEIEQTLWFHVLKPILPVLMSLSHATLKSFLNT